VPTGEPDQFIECDDVLVAIGQENAFPWIETDLGLDFDEWGMPVLDKVTLQSTLPQVFFGGDSAFGPKNIIWAVAHGHEAAISIDKFLNAEELAQRPAPVSPSSRRRWASMNGATTTRSRPTGGSRCRGRTRNWR
jgi:pyruvate/2-oxoglutarate dehydrogenase complex dihydrolipoamide dehydrogenase (E3) component